MNPERGRMMRRLLSACVFVVGIALLAAGFLALALKGGAGS